jgi:hypothetical protein
MCTWLTLTSINNISIYPMWPPLWSSVQSSWLQIRRSRFDSWRYQIFVEVVGLEWGPLSLLSTTEELLGRKCSSSGLENREYGRKDPSRWPHNTLYLQKLALTSPANGGRSVGIVHSWTKAMELLLLYPKSWTATSKDSKRICSLYEDLYTSPRVSTDYTICK